MGTSLAGSGHRGEEYEETRLRATFGVGAIRASASSESELEFLPRFDDNPTMPELAPTQQRALDALLTAVQPGRLVTLIASPGNGKTTILEAAYNRLGGKWLAAGDIDAAIAARHPLSMEHALHHLDDAAVVDADVWFVDDLHLLRGVIECYHSYRRGGLVQLAMKAHRDRARAIGHAIVVAVEHPFA